LLFFSAGVEHCHATVRVQTQIQIENESHVTVQDGVQCDQADANANMTEIQVDALVVDVVDDSAGKNCGLNLSTSNNV
jgi:hypothetical protein